MSRARAIIHLEDRARRDAAVLWISEAGFETDVVDSHRAMGQACDQGDPSVVVVEGPLSPASGVEAVQWLRRGGLSCPVVFVCGSAIESRALKNAEGIAPYAACSAFEADALMKIVRESHNTLLDRTVPGSGSLGEHGLESLIARCSAVGFTGKIELQSKGTSKTVYVDRGRPVYCSSSILSENFGQVLLRKGIITEVEYNWARKLQQREGIRQGEALVKIGVLSHETLFEQLRDQIREKIVNAFGWDTGTYTFVADEGSLHHVTRFIFNPVDLMVEGRGRFIVKEDTGAMWDRISDTWIVRSFSPTVLSPAVDEWLGEDARRALGSPCRFGSLARSQGWDKAHALSIFETMSMLGELMSAQEASALPAAVAMPDGAWHPLEHDDPSSVDESRDGDEAHDGEQVDQDALSEGLWKAYLRLTSADHFEALGVTQENEPSEVLSARDELLGHYSASRYRPLLDVPRLSHALKEIRAKLRAAADTLTDTKRRGDYLESMGCDPKGERDRYLSAEDAFVAGISMLEGEPRSACRYFIRASQLNPHEAVYQMYRGWSLYRYADTPEQRQEARRHIAQAVGANPLLDDGYVFLGHMYLDSGDAEEACAQARTALAFNPGNEKAIDLLVEAGQGESAPKIASTWM